MSVTQKGWQLGETVTSSSSAGNTTIAQGRLLYVWPRPHPRGALVSSRRFRPSRHSTPCTLSPLARRALKLVHNGRPGRSFFSSFLSSMTPWGSRGEGAGARSCWTRAGCRVRAQCGLWGFATLLKGTSAVG